MLITVDTSVAYKWLVEEEGSVLADKLLDQPEKLIAPTHLHNEIKSSLSRSLRQNRIDEEEARLLLQRWEQDIAPIIQFISTDSVTAEAFDLACRIRHAYFDCLFLALAQKAQAILITADANFAVRARQAYADVQLLEEFAFASF